MAKEVSSDISNLGWYFLAYKEMNLLTQGTMPKLKSLLKEMVGVKEMILLL